MDLRQVFINAAGRLRSGWRLLIFVAVFMLFWLLLTTMARVGFAVSVRAGINFGPFLQDVVFRLMLLLAALAAGFICNYGLERLPFRALGLWLHPGWLRDLLVGSAIGIATLALAAAFATACGGLTFTFSGRAALLQVGKTLILSGSLFILAALAEEALFRGYPLQTLTRAGLAWLAILLTSVPFALVHLNNPNVVGGFTFINTALAGVWLAVAYLRTRSLWFPLGVHWAWNWALASLFGLPVSGITNLAPHPLLHGIDLGPAWLTGGTYGLEGGVAGTIALVVSTIFIWRTQLVSATPEMEMLTSQENPVAGFKNGGKAGSPSGQP